VHRAVRTRMTPLAGRCNIIVSCNHELLIQSFSTLRSVTQRYASQWIVINALDNLIYALSFYYAKINVRLFLINVVKECSVWDAEGSLVVEYCIEVSK